MHLTRSFLFVPADSEKKLEKAAGSGADALIVDLEDSVVPAERPRARGIAKEFLEGRHAPALWVRINPLDTEDALVDLSELMPTAPAGIVLPKPEGADDALRLAEMLGELEQENNLPVGQTRILPIATERPAALLALGGYARATPRLAGLTWGAEDLSTALGALATRDEQGRWLPAFELARSLCLIAAAAAEVPAIDTVFTDFRNIAGLEDYCARARRDGFCGMLAIHPSQVPVINRAFVPSAGEIERARRIVALFEDNPEAGALGMDGEMIDRPHWLKARRVIELAERVSQEQQKKG
ncbi:MAG TPA: CoA ester lyase [Woeseiaceae bacterium]|nr:CoA ester lyase [Woeseiaceae bacterium]